MPIKKENCTSISYVSVFIIFKYNSQFYPYIQEILVVGEGKQVRDSQLLLLGVPQKPHAKNYNIFSEDLVHSHVDSVIASLASVSPNEPIIVGIVGHSLTVSSTHPHTPAPKILPLLLL